MKTLVIEGENGPVIKEHDGVDLSRMNQAARVEYWQRQGSAAIFNAAFQLMEHYCQQKGIDATFDKTVERFGRRISDK